MCGIQIVFQEQDTENGCSAKNVPQNFPNENISNKILIFFEDVFSRKVSDTGYLIIGYRLSFSGMFVEDVEREITHHNEKTIRRRHRDSESLKIAEYLRCGAQYTTPRKIIYLI